jgi:hypothetical protein
MKNRITSCLFVRTKSTGSRGIRALALACVLAVMAGAAPILELIPADGQIQGMPGSTVGWGFSITPSSTEWISVTGSFLLFETNPGIGSYEEFIGFKGGPDDGVIVPGGAIWHEEFDAASSMGIGSYTIAPFVLLGFRNDATLFVFYERFSGDPRNCGSCSLGTSEWVTGVGSLVGESSENPIPEPGTLLVSAVALVLLGLQRLRRLRASC